MNHPDKRIYKKNWHIIAVYTTNPPSLQGIKMTWPDMDSCSTRKPYILKTWHSWNYKSTGGDKQFEKSAGRNVKRADQSKKKRKKQEPLKCATTLSKQSLKKLLLRRELSISKQLRHESRSISSFLRTFFSTLIIFEMSRSGKLLGSPANCPLIFWKSSKAITPLERK